MSGAAPPRSVSFDYAPPNGDLLEATKLLIKLDQHHGSGSCMDEDCQVVLDDYRPYTVTTYKPHRGSVTICARPEDENGLRQSFDNLFLKA